MGPCHEGGQPPDLPVADGAFTSDPSRTLDHADRFVRVMDNAVVVVTAADSSQRSGCLVGFVTQVSIRPWRIMAALSKENHTFSVAQRAEHLVLHLLTDRDRPMARLFGELTGDGIDKLALVPCEEGPGHTVMVRGLSGLITRVVDRVDFGDHVGHVLEPVGSFGPDPGDRRSMTMNDVVDFEPGHPRS